MSKSWEIKLTSKELYKFRQILKDLKAKKVSHICPFDSDLCNRNKPTCANFVKGLKQITYEKSCPCYKFRTKSLIWRIERLLKYNKLFIRHKHISIHSISKGRNKDAT